MKRLLLFLALFSAGLSPSAQAQTSAKKANAKTAPPASAGDWTTPAEKSDYRTTPRYDETTAYVRRVAAAAPKQVKVESFGKSPEGREMLVAIVSKDGRFEPAAVRKSGRAVLMIQNAIHPGEMDGKDACLALLRDMVITK